MKNVTTSRATEWFVTSSGFCIAKERKKQLNIRVVTCFTQCSAPATVMFTTVQVLLPLVDYLRNRQNKQVDLFLSNNKVEVV